jgi:hypothetical protein
MRTNVVGLVLAAAVVVGCNPLALLPDDPYEPNDALEIAYDLTAAGTPEVVEDAVITEVDPKDYFTFLTPDSGCTHAVLAGVCVPDKLFTIVLMDDAGTTLWSASQTGTMAMNQPVTLTTRYYLSIELAAPVVGDASVYAFTLSFN